MVRGCIDPSGYPATRFVLCVQSIPVGIAIRYDRCSLAWQRIDLASGYAEGHGYRILCVALRDATNARFLLSADDPIRSRVTNRKSYNYARQGT